MTKPSPKSNNSEHHDMFTRAIPDPSLYEYYADRKGRIRNTELPIWRRNSTLNPDYVLISLRRTQGSWSVIIWMNIMNPGAMSKSRNWHRN